MQSCTEESEDQSKEFHQVQERSPEERSITVSKKEDIVVDVQKFLSLNGRCIRNIARDGNCFFRTISCHLLGTECEYIAVRTLLLRFENLNQALFEKVSSPLSTSHCSKIISGTYYNQTYGALRLN